MCLLMLSTESALLSSSPNSWTPMCFFLSWPEDIFFSLLSERKREKGGKEAGEEPETEREREKWKGRDTWIGCLLVRTPTGALTHNLGVCPSWEVNFQHSVHRMTPQPTEPHEPGPNLLCFNSTILSRFGLRRFLLVKCSLYFLN